MTHFRSIHYLRGLAAVMVVIFHICTTAPVIDPGLAKTFWLQSGVDIFFIISGFVMIISTRNDSSVEKFLFDRAVRIVPIYWIITLFVAALFAGMNSEMLLPSLSFFPVHDVETGRLVSAIIPPAWTLSLEMFFYVIFAFMLKISYVKKLICFAIIFCALQAVRWVSPTPTLSFYTNPIIIEFWLGMILARYHQWGRWWMLPVGIVLLWTVGPSSRLGSLSFTPGALLIVAGALSMERKLKDSPSLRRLGDLSYVLYLLHMTVIIIAYSIFGQLLAAAPITFLGGTLILSIGAAWLVHRVIEKPLFIFMKNPGRFDTVDTPHVQGSRF